MTTNNHCKYNNIWDSTTKKYRCCKNKRLHDNYCMIHYKLLYNNYTIIIQKIYKGYYIRKKLKIYYNLPRDLQRKIIWHINSDLYLRNYNSSLSKIIYRRYKEFYNKHISTTTINFFNNLSMISNDSLNVYIYSEIFSEVYADLIYLVKLSIKYFLIIKICKTPYFYNIKCLCRNIEKLYYIKNPNDSNLIILRKFIYLF